MRGTEIILIYCPGGGGRGSVWGGGQGGCEQRIEVFVKIQKKMGGGGGVGSGGMFRVGDGECGRGVRVDVYGEVKFL